MVLIILKSLPGLAVLALTMVFTVLSTNPDAMAENAEKWQRWAETMLGDPLPPSVFVAVSSETARWLIPVVGTVVGFVLIILLNRPAGSRPWDRPRPAPVTGVNAYMNVH